MDKIIESKNASISTMSVTISAIQVGDRQMTLSVFRQLPITDLFDEDSMDGDVREDLELWGIVRYALKDGGSEWVVASADGVLYRCHFNQFQSAFDDMRSLERLEKIGEPTDRSRAQWTRRQYFKACQARHEASCLRNSLPQLFIAV